MDDIWKLLGVWAAWMGDVVGDFGIRALTQLGSLSELGLTELLTLNAIGATFGVLAIQTYAEVILQRRERYTSLTGPPRSRSIVRLERLVVGFIAVAVLSAASTALALMDKVAPKPLDGGATVRYTLTYYASVASVIAAGIASIQLIAYAFLELLWELLWPDRGARYARNRVRPPDPPAPMGQLPPGPTQPPGPDKAANES
ncbi:MAG TPA: hypothetical protein VGO52_06990 [Hyphomonadaceae bacterium]|nr:hypothetical protein [Hyphomonadaceae bacterium]